MVAFFTRKCLKYKNTVSICEIPVCHTGAPYRPVEHHDKQVIQDAVCQRVVTAMAAKRGYPSVLTSVSKV